MKTLTVRGTTYKSSGKWIEIKYSKDLPYFLSNGRKEFLNNYVRTNSGWIDMPEHYEAGLHAFDSMDNRYPDFITLNSTGEAVMIWRQVL